MGFLSGITSFVKEHSEVIHGVLDVAGFIPGVGAVADLANAGLYAAEGDYLNAGLSLVSAIPGIGDTVALAKKSVNAVKGGLKSLKGLKNINALKKAKGIKKALAGMRGKAKTGASRLKKGKVKKKGKLEPPDEAIDAIKKGQKKKCLTDKCFTGDTLVYTSQGYKPIKEIRKGDEVYSRDEKTGETSLKEVVEVFCTTAHTIYHIWVDGKEEFKITAYHPVYVHEQGWVTAINLRKGDIIETMDGFVHITKVERTRHEEAVAVYNFHVKDWVSYFVGTMMVYVHNSPGEHNERFLDNIIKLLKKGEKTKDGRNIITTLDEDTKIIFRRDIGENAHAMSKFGYDKPVDHINIEIHHKKPNGNYKAKWDFHIILDDLGKVVKTIETGKWSKK